MKLTGEVADEDANGDFGEVVNQLQALQMQMILEQGMCWRTTVLQTKHQMRSEEGIQLMLAEIHKSKFDGKATLCDGLIRRKVSYFQSS